jgi:hypothetical protein
MFNNGAQLPVPADSLVSGNWVQDPMTAQLPVPQKPFFVQNPNLIWIMGLTAATLVASLQENCQGGPVSAFAYNLFSQQQYNNNFWLTICDDAAEFALQQLQVMQHGANPQQTVASAARFYAAYAAAACVPKWPALQGYMNQEMMAKVSQLIAQMQTLQGANNANNMGMYQPNAASRQNNGPWGTGSSDVGQFATGTGAASLATNMGSLAFTAAVHDENSKFGNPGRRKAVPDGRKPAATNEPVSDLAALGVVEVDTVGVAKPAVASVHPEVARAIRPRPRPQPLEQSASVEAQPTPVAPPQAPQSGMGGEIPAAVMQSPAPSLSVSNDIPELDVLGVDDSAWADKIDQGHFHFDDTPKPEYKIDTVGRFLVRPKRSGITLPETLEDAKLEEDEDLEILDVAALPNGPEDLTVLELDDGNVAVQVTAGDPGRTWSIQNPHNNPYDPTLFLRYLVQTESEGTFEAFLLRDKDVDYIDLEFDLAKRARARQERMSKQVILADLSVLQEIKPRGVPYTIIGATDQLDLLEGDADQTKLLDEVEKFQGKLNFFEAAEGQAELCNAIYQIDHFFEHVKARNAVPVTFGRYTRSFIAPGITTKVAAITDCPRREQLPKIILFVRDLEQYCPRAFLYLNELLTKEVNRVTDAAVGFGEFSITSFADDYFELTTTIEEGHGESAFNKLNEAVARCFLSIGFSYKGTTLTIEHAYNVMGLPIGFASFKLPTRTGESYVVTASEAPELYTLLDLVKCDEATPKNAKTYITGLDGEVFEAIESIWDEGYVTLLRV